MARPDIATPIVQPKRSGGKITTETNLVSAVSGTLFYELMVFWYAIGDDRAMSRYNDKIFEKLKKNYGKYLDGKARAMPRQYHHVYEWNMLGKEAGRLWKLTKRNSGKNTMDIKYQFIQSKRVAPIDPILRTPGPTGKVVKKSSVFKNKAFVMEENLPVTMRPKNGKWLAIPNRFVFSPGKNIMFSRGPVTVRNPGGNDTKYSFAKTFNGYFASGLAVKDLKASGVLDTPARITKRAGENVPSAIARASFSRGVDKEFIARLAQAEVEAQAGREYND